MISRSSLFVALIFTLLTVNGAAWRTCLNTGVHSAPWWIKGHIMVVCGALKGWYGKHRNGRALCISTDYIGLELGSYDFSVLNTDPNNDHYFDGGAGCEEIFRKLDSACPQGGTWSLETLPWQFSMDPNHLACPR